MKRTNMESGLDRTVRDLLPQMQERICHVSTYFGIPTMKCPNDFWVYQELLCELRPDVVLEIGNHHGGSALAIAHLMDALGHGRVIGLDIEHSRLSPLAKSHPRIRFIEGDACESYAAVRKAIAPREKTLVIEDSSHTYDNTLRVMRCYQEFVHPGGYLVVEDGICHHGLDLGPNPGPFEAVETFLGEYPDFEADRGREAFFITWNPNGFLRRKEGCHS